MKKLFLLMLALLCAGSLQAGVYDFKDDEYCFIIIDDNGIESVVTLEGKKYPLYRDEGEICKYYVDPEGERVYIL